MKLFLLLPVLVMALAGCANTPADAAAKSVSVEQQIKNLENDTKTPPQIKEGLLASLRARAAKQPSGTPTTR